MSRIGRLPIQVPPSVDVSIVGRDITVKGPKGTLSRALHPDMTRLDGGLDAHRGAAQPRPSTTSSCTA